MNDSEANKSEQKIDAHTNPHSFSSGTDLRNSFLTEYFAVYV